MVGGKKLLPPAATQKAACNAFITTSNIIFFKGKKRTSLLVDEVNLFVNTVNVMLNNMHGFSL